MKYKPYRKNKVLAKLQAARARLGRLYASELPDEAKVYLRNAAGELGLAGVVLEGYKEEVPNEDS